MLFIVFFFFFFFIFFLFFSSGGKFVRRSETISAILIQGHQKNVPVKWVTGLGGDGV